MKEVVVIREVVMWKVRLVLVLFVSSVFVLEWLWGSGVIPKVLAMRGCRR